MSEPKRVLSMREMRALQNAAANKENAPETPKKAAVSEDLREKLQEVKTDTRYTRFLAETPDAVIGNQLKWITEFLDNVNAELAANTDTETRYTRILLEHDPAALRENGKRQLNAIAQHWQERYGDDEEAKKRLAQFVVFAQRLQPVRVDKPGLPYQQFESPRRVGSASSFGEQDPAVQADRYIYASFDGIRHYMAASTKNSYRINESGIADRAEIVMQDIANAAGRGRDRLMRRYLDNLFDYRHGKQILAYYLASVFESPQEAERFLEKNNGQQQAQHWDKGLLIPAPEKVTLQEGEDDNALRARWLAADARSEVRKQQIEDAMKAILNDTGIEPPLSLEVRIPDTAPIIRDTAE